MNTMNSDRRESSNGSFIMWVIIGIICIALFVPTFRNGIVWGFGEVVRTFNLPVLTLNPHGQVVKIEADGKIYTKDSHRNFDELVRQYKKSRYETNHTSRLDGKP